MRLVNRPGYVLPFLVSIIATVALPAWSAYPYELYKQDRAFREAVRVMIGKNPPQWLRGLRGVQPQIEEVSAGNQSESYLLINVCKPHNCDTEAAVILYSAKQREAYGKLESGAKVKTLGNPPDDIDAELESRLRPSR